MIFKDFKFFTILDDVCSLLVERKRKRKGGKEEEVARM